MSHTAEIDAKFDKEETSPLSEEEQKYADAALAGLTAEQREKITPLDIVTIVRGYQTYEPRLEETNKAMKMIADWRDEVGYYDFLVKPLSDSDKFHTLWPERVYGPDKYGHLITVMRLEEIDTNAISDMDMEKVLQLQGQKMAALTKYKKLHAESQGVQRYKHIIIADMKGVGMGLLSGSRRNTIKAIMDVGGNYFPESVWKIFVVNTPFMFRACWAVVKPWIHPITVAKVNIHGSVKDAVKKMAEVGVPLESLPEWLGGTHEGKAISDILAGYIAEGGQGESKEQTADI